MKGINFMHHNFEEYIYEIDYKKGTVEVLGLDYQLIEKHDILTLPDLPDTNPHRDLLISLISI